MCDIEASFVASKEGTYVVTFTSYDVHEGMSTISYRYIVMDKESPSIQVDTSKINVKVGEKVVVPTAAVTDNVTQDIVCYIFVIMPEGNYVVVENNEFTFTDAGSYEIVYVAIDSQDNIARKAIKVTVTE